jgi:hypothetical protein
MKYFAYGSNDNQMDLLFYGSKMPLEPIEGWVTDQLKKERTGINRCG